MCAFDVGRTGFNIGRTHGFDIGRTRGSAPTMLPNIFSLFCVHMVIKYKPDCE